ncbi:MAG: DUF2474 domain-containing protein [Novosphingobium sp.]
MRFEPRLEPPERQTPLMARLGWLVVYWVGGVAALGVVGLVLRLWLAR